MIWPEELAEWGRLGRGARLGVALVVVAGVAFLLWGLAVLLRLALWLAEVLP